MDAKQYIQASDRCLAAVARWLESFDPDELDFSTTDGVVTLEFPGRVRFVLNRQSAVNQMWFAAGASAWHYVWDEASRSWRGEKDGHELFQRIGELVSARLGRDVGSPQ